MEHAPGGGGGGGGAGAGAAEGAVGAPATSGIEADVPRPCKPKPDV